MAARLLVVAAVASTALAFSNTSPIVAWSSSSSPILDSLPSRLDAVAHSASVFEAIFGSDDICDYDAVVIVEQPGLHASDLRSLSPDSHLARSLRSYPSARQYPYVPDLPELDILSIAHGISTKCRSKFLSYTPGDSEAALDSDTKHVACMKMPHLKESGKARKDAMKEHESTLETELSTFTSAFHNHLIVYAGSPLSSSPFFKRQAADVPDRPILDFEGVDIYDNTTLPEGGILKRYQLLTPALISTLLVSFFILVPVLFFGLTALASVQNPVRSDVSKTFNAQERKNQ